MTVKEMVEALVDKGHNRAYAEQTAWREHGALAFDDELPERHKIEECSVCRRRFTNLQMKYHYHPCE
jgi:hypothetical protein